MNEIDKAERYQAWKAFLIPMSLFVACLFNAAGIYILYSGNGIGIFFVGFGITIIVAGMFLFITFHNKQRAEGKWKRVAEDATTPPAPPLDRDKYPDWGTESGGTSDLTPVDPMPALTSTSSSNARR